MRLQKIVLFSSFVLSILFLINISCKKEIAEKEEEVDFAEPYIRSLIEPIEPDDSVYFVRIKFADSELYYSAKDPAIQLSPGGFSGTGIIGKGYRFNNSTTKDKIDIMFFIPDSSLTFTFQCADYRYGNPYGGWSGPNVLFWTPAEEKSSSSQLYVYLGRSEDKGYFWITWLSENRICGRFKTTLVEHFYSNLLFKVEGEFNIPRVINFD